MKDDLWQKTTFDKRQALAEDSLWQKTTFDRRQPLTEADLWWKTTFDGRQPLTKDELWRKTTFDGRLPLTEDKLWRKMTDNHHPLLKIYICASITTFCCTSLWILRFWSECVKIWIANPNLQKVTDFAHISGYDAYFFTLIFELHPLDQAAHFEYKEPYKQQKYFFCW